MLSSLKAHRDSTKIVEVLEESSIDLLFKSHNDSHWETQCKVAVAKSVTDGSKWLSLSRSSVQVYEINIASSPADGFLYRFYQFLLLKKLRDLRPVTINQLTHSNVVSRPLPVQIGIDVTNFSLQRPRVPSQQNYLAT